MEELKHKRLGVLEELALEAAAEQRFQEQERLPNRKERRAVEKLKRIREKKNA